MSEELLVDFLRFFMIEHCCVLILTGYVGSSKKTVSKISVDTHFKSPWVMYVQNCGGLVVRCRVYTMQLRDIVKTVEGYHKCLGGYSILWREIISIFEGFH